MPFTFDVLSADKYLDPDGVFSEDANTNNGVVGRSTFTVNSFELTELSVAGDRVDDRGSDLSEPVTINGTAYAAGERAENDYEVIFRDPETDYLYRFNLITIADTPVGVTVSPSWDQTAGAYVSARFPVGRDLVLVAGEDLEGSPNIRDFLGDEADDYTEGDYASDDVEVNQNTVLAVCFTSDVMIETSEGPVPAGDLAPGDLVHTVDNGLQEVRWINSRRITRAQIQANPGLRPVRIAAGALGFGLPERDLLVSQQHRVLVDSRMVRNLHGTPQMIVAAKQLVALDGIDIVEMDEVTYVHFLLDRHELVYAEGAVAETLFTGPEAVRAIHPAALKEVFALFPELRDYARTGWLPDPVRPILNGKDGRRMAQRMKKNGRFPLEIEKPEAVH